MPFPRLVPHSLTHLPFPKVPSQSLSLTLSITFNAQPVFSCSHTLPLALTAAQIMTVPLTYFASSKALFQFFQLFFKLSFGCLLSWIKPRKEPQNNREASGLPVLFLMQNLLDRVRFTLISDDDVNLRGGGGGTVPGPDHFDRQAGRDRYLIITVLYLLALFLNWQVVVKERERDGLAQPQYVRVATGSIIDLPLSVSVSSPSLKLSMQGTAGYCCPRLPPPSKYLPNMFNTPCT